MPRHASLGCAIAVLTLAIGCSSDPESVGPHAGATSSGSSGSGGGSSTSTSGSGGAGGTGGAGGQGDDPRFDALKAAVDAELKELGAPGGAVAVIENGEVTFAKGFGSKDPNGDDPVQSTTLFRIGSVTKMLTATALLHEVAVGHVDLAAPVTTYVPDFHFNEDPTWASSITVQHLLTHSSGMYDYLKIGGAKADSALAAFMTGTFASVDYLMAPAGAFWNYSNPNFYLAGLIAETTAGKPYRDVVKEDVFDKLGMTRTFFLGSEVIADGDYALGKADYPGVPAVVKPDSYENAWARPAGYATSSVLDLAKFAEFLLDGNEDVLPKELSDAMQSPQVQTLEILDDLSYGYALFVWDKTFLKKTEVYDIKLVEHGGDIPGFAADVKIIPSLHFGFVALANADVAHLRKSFATAVQTLTSLPPPIPPPDLLPDPATFSAHVGTYNDPYNVGDIVVSLEGGDLVVSMPELDAANVPYDSVLKPAIGAANFELGIQGQSLPVTFVPDATGASTYFRTRVFVGARVPEAPAPGGPAPSAIISPDERRARVAAALATVRPDAISDRLR